VANGVPRLELSRIVTDEGVIFTSGSGVGLQPKHVAVQINASNVAVSCFTLRSSQTGDEPHFRPARVFRRALTPLTGRFVKGQPRDYSGHGDDVDQAAEAIRDEEWRPRSNTSSKASMAANAIAPKSQRRRPGQLFIPHHIAVRCTVSVAYVA
jgi:hypothetical protein